jgi:hypothetical protein
MIPIPGKSTLSTQSTAIDFKALDEVQGRISKNLTAAYKRCKSQRYIDDEVRALKRAGVLLPNSFRPISPLKLEIGEKFCSDNSD